MDYIHVLLIAEDDLTDQPEEHPNDVFDQETATETQTIPQLPQPSSSNTAPTWCVCNLCNPMPLEIENKCCKHNPCVTLSSRFQKLCLDPDVLKLCIKNVGDIRNDREDNSTRAFRKAAYRQFILARHGYLGRGNRRVCPSCVVCKIRESYPSVTGVYMGFRDH